MTSMLFRYVMLPFSLCSVTFFGFDRISAELYKRELIKDIHEQVSQEAYLASSQSRSMTAETMVRNVLRKNVKQFERKGIPYDYTVAVKPNRINVSVNTLYKTKISQFFGTPDIKTKIDLYFDVAQ